MVLQNSDAQIVGYNSNKNRFLQNLRPIAPSQSGPLFLHFQACIAAGVLRLSVRTEKGTLNLVAGLSTTQENYNLLVIDAELPSSIYFSCFRPGGAALPRVYKGSHAHFVVRSPPASPAETFEQFGSLNGT